MIRNNFSKKRIIQAAAALAFAAALSASAAAGQNHVSDKAAENVASASAKAGSYASAGATAAMTGLESKAYQKALTLSSSDLNLTAQGEAAPVSDEGTAVLAKAENKQAAASEASLDSAVDSVAVSPAMVTTEMPEAEPEKAEPVDEWASRVMANVESEMNIRKDPSVEAEIIGVFRRGDVADAVEKLDGWTKITSGSVTGYVKTDYLISGDQAKALSAEMNPVKATSLTDGLNVRSAATTDAGLVDMLSNGQSLPIDPSYDRSSGWTKVICKNSEGYVKNDYVSIGQDFTSAITMDEYKAILEEKKAKEQAEIKKKKSSSQIGTSSATYVQNDSVSANASDLDLLAALIYCEAGAESYEGQVAVGATVMNRMRSGIYSNTIRGAIYDPWAYSPTWTGVLDRALRNGNFCYAAAQDALNGVDPTGGAMCFKLASSGHPGVVIGKVVFF